jgi:O-antigen ligase
VLAAIALAAALGSAGVFEKQKAQFATGDVLNFRDRVWRIAIEAWQAHPWFGVGVDNFSLLTRSEQEPYRTLYTHAHSLYFNTLAERGVIGSAPLAAILGALLVALARGRPRSGDPDQDWLLWGAAASAWIVTCVAGTVNTTLHHEHGLLAALLVGLWLGQRLLQAPGGESRGV